MESKLNKLGRWQAHIRRKGRQYGLFVFAEILTARESLDIWRWFWKNWSNVDKEDGSIRCKLLPSIGDKDVISVMQGDAWTFAPKPLQRAILARLAHDEHETEQESDLPEDEDEDDDSCDVD
jgi:hypothetical protein